jgi:hypothetical protein
MGKEFFFCLKRRSVHASAAATQLYRMAQMKHLVVDEVLNRIAGNTRAIKHAADDYGVVRRIVMSQAVARVIDAPGHLRARHQAEKEPGIQRIENLFQVIVRALGSMDLFAPAHLPDQMGLGGDALAPGKLAEARRMAIVDLLAVELRDQNVQDGVQHVVRSALHQVREPHQDTAFPQTNGVVQIGEREELDFKFGKRRSRTQLPIGVLKKNRNSGVHQIQISTARKIG